MPTTCINQNEIEFFILKPINTFPCHKNGIGVVQSEIRDRYLQAILLDLVKSASPERICTDNPDLKPLLFIIICIFANRRCLACTLQTNKNNDIVNQILFDHHRLFLRIKKGNQL
ncbi:hypothetical protein EQH57_1030 [Dictyocoela roeselum]|nr:hypothetical protein EQH57_1030 [Dictyocoela roeselum]